MSKQKPLVSLLVKKKTLELLNLLNIFKSKLTIIIDSHVAIDYYLIEGSDNCLILNYL